MNYFLHLLTLLTRYQTIICLNLDCGPRFCCVFDVLVFMYLYLWKDRFWECDESR